MKKEKKEGEGHLFVLGTPIGNLDDMTTRAVLTLREADYVLAEDTRVTQKLLAHFEIKKPLVRCDEYAQESLYEKVYEDILEGKQIVFVSDAGTPGIADPVAKLIHFLSEKIVPVSIIPIPGVSAVTTILSVAGVHANQFVFMGYPPHKKGREKFFKEAQGNAIRPLVFFESPHRFLKTLEFIEKFFGTETKLVVGRELTKMHEEVFRGDIASAKEYFIPSKIRGEFVLVII